MIRKILLQFKESVLSVLPIYLFIIIVSVTSIINLNIKELLVFSVATLFLIIGMTFFNLGANIAMTPMGKATGSGLTKQGKIFILLIFGFVLGFLVTIAEPDLAVLANQTKNVFKPTLLIISVAVGVGLFLLLAIIKTIHKINLSHLLMFFYMALFALALIAVITGNQNILAMALDSGGVTTGPITVPFLMALGLGVSQIISSKSDKDASFGLIALCSVGPIIVIIILAIFTSGILTYQIPDYSLCESFFLEFGHAIISQLKSVGIAVLLIVLSFLICNVAFLKIAKAKLLKMGIGVVYTYIGLVIFLASVEVVYMSVGFEIGVQLSNKDSGVIIIIGFVIGALTVLAEPAIHVLKAQVEEITGGLIKQKSLMIALVIGVGIAISLAVIRIIYSFSILYYIIPGYIICFGLSFFIPKIYTAIAFDSGGVASGPLTSSFILPLAIGICNSLTGIDNVLTDAFGVVSLVAMTPLITIEGLGLFAIVKDRIRSKKAIKKAMSNSDKVIVEFM